MDRIEDDTLSLFTCLGLFSLKKKIEDAVLRAEMLAPLALELEEERRNEQEQLIRKYDLWDDTAKSNEILAKLADSVRVVDALRDLTYKVTTHYQTWCICCYTILSIDVSTLHTFKSIEWYVYVAMDV